MSPPGQDRHDRVRPHHPGARRRHPRELDGDAHGRGAVVKKGSSARPIALMSTRSKVSQFDPVPAGPPGRACRASAACCACSSRRPSRSTRPASRGRRAGCSKASSPSTGCSSSPADRRDRCAGADRLGAAGIPEEDAGKVKSGKAGSARSRRSSARSPSARPARSWASSSAPDRRRFGTRPGQPGSATMMPEMIKRMGELAGEEEGTRARRTAGMSRSPSTHSAANLERGCGHRPAGAPGVAAAAGPAQICR